MDNPQQSSGIGLGGESLPAPSHSEELGVSPPIETVPPAPALSDPVSVAPPFLGDRSSSPPPFTIGKPPEPPEPTIVPPEPIPEEKFVPNRIILIAVAVLLVVLVVVFWWFFRPKSEQVGPGEAIEPPAIEEPSPTPVIPAEAELPEANPSSTVALTVSPTRTLERATPTRIPPTPIPTVPEKPLPEAGNVSQTFFMIISGVGAIVAGLLFLL